MQLKLFNQLHGNYIFWYSLMTEKTRFVFDSLRLKVQLTFTNVGWFWEDTQVNEVVGSNSSTRYWMDLFYIILLQKLQNVSFKRPKTNNTEARKSPFLKQ